MRKEMKVTLVEYTPMADMVCDLAARACISETVDPESFQEECRSLKAAMESGHDSIMEHATFTFYIEGISRACSHQLVRHRLASYAQQSQRYVKMSGCFDYVTPPEIAKDAVLKAKYDDAMRNIQHLYDDMIEIGYIQPEDARYILPNACCTNVTMTMNGRELYHFLELRLCKRAQWEIRELAEKIKEQVQDAAPIMFENVGPQCKRLGYCPETYGCGLCPSKKEVLEKVNLVTNNANTVVPPFPPSKNCSPNSTGTNGNLGKPVIWWVPGLSVLRIKDIFRDTKKDETYICIEDQRTKASCKIFIPGDGEKFIKGYAEIDDTFKSLYLEAFLRNMPPEQLIDLKAM